MCLFMTECFCWFGFICDWPSFIWIVMGHVLKVVKSFFFHLFRILRCFMMLSLGEREMPMWKMRQRLQFLTGIRRMDLCQMGTRRTHLSCPFMSSFKIRYFHIYLSCHWHSNYFFMSFRSTLAKFDSSRCTIMKVSNSFLVQWLKFYDL